MRKYPLTIMLKVYLNDNFSSITALHVDVLPVILDQRGYIVILQVGM